MIKDYIMIISTINEYINSLKTSPRMGHQVVFHEVISGQNPVWEKPDKAWAKSIKAVMTKIGLHDFYSHQARAINLVRDNKDVIVATPTASGKTFIYNFPVLENIHNDPSSKALYLFPMKALEQDQMRVFENMVTEWEGKKPTVKIYDGDTTSYHRRKIREFPPNVLITNPEMLHLSILPYHDKWASFLTGLKTVVIDEVHTFRGVMGSHMAHVFRRFKRIFHHYNVNPDFIFSSATIGNPVELVETLTGNKPELVDQSGAPRGKKHILFIDPAQGTAQTAILLLKAALHRELRTIVYTQSRRLTELISMWVSNQTGEYTDRISAYRSGFLPEERREIEAKLSSGELLAVISTSALELGIDIGDLDLCILVGYPGSIVATWQRSGRVGRSGQDSALILVAGEDALDQYFLHHPEALLKTEPESAVINPYNPAILKKHLVCAAAEIPIKSSENIYSGPEEISAIRDLENSGDLLRSADGKTLFSKLKMPHRHVNLRGSGDRFNIICSETEENIGEIDGIRVYHETHPGAIYIHKGTTYLVERIDPETQTVYAIEADVNYYTKVMAQKDTEIINILHRKNVWNTNVYFGILKVTDQVTGYERRRIQHHKRLLREALDLPPQIFETEGIWFEIPPHIQQEIESEFMHFMGGIHAIEHAAIGIFPLLVLADRNDIGGISIPFHPQLGCAAVFIYDGIPGGAGLSRQAYSRAQTLFEKTMDIIEHCPCETGCPGCVHSPKCGSGNRPIDKAAALFLLKALKSVPPEQTKSKQKIETLKHAKTETNDVVSQKKIQDLHYIVLDIETQKSAREVGGWHRADLMLVSCVVIYDSKKKSYETFLEHQVHDLIDQLGNFDLIIGFNIKRFDYRVLQGYRNFNFKALPTLDLLELVHKRLGYRLGLDHLANVTLGVQKNADGLQALRWWKQGKVKEIVEYCQKDVKITRDLYLYAKANGFLLFKNKAGNIVRVPLDIN
ncbi:MAG: DEAD/DEAH box helicase [Desulfobacterales bacterium]|nr:DEAD/DEAH box helicase [Desulfobacterales bacterium]